MRKFGLIGFPLSHSFSQKYFLDKFLRESIRDCAYENYPIPSIGDLRPLLEQEPLLEGLNVTIPYKKQVLGILDSESPVVAMTKACNCLVIRGGRIRGYNTDTVGFEVSLRKKLARGDDRALVLGTGGAAAAVSYTLAKLGISFLLVSRNPAPAEGILAYTALTQEIIASHSLIINTTPAGMYPETRQFPEIPYEGITGGHYLFDLIYNPEKTVFLQKGEVRGARIQNGWEMLCVQAEESWRIWNGPQTD